MDMELNNPFTDLIFFSKALPMEPTSSTVIGALRRTGKHLGHGQDLTHVRGRASGGRKPSIERYTTSPRGLKMGPFKGSGKLLPTVTRSVSKSYLEASRRPFDQGLVYKGLGGALKSGAARVGRRTKAAPAAPRHVSDAPKFDFDGPAHPPAPKMNWDKPQPRSKLMDDAAARRAKAAEPRKTPPLASLEQQETNRISQARARGSAQRSAAIRNDHGRTRYVPGGPDASGRHVPGGFSYSQ